MPSKYFLSIYFASTQTNFTLTSWSNIFRYFLCLPVFGKSAGIIGIQRLPENLFIISNYLKTRTITKSLILCTLIDYKTIWIVSHLHWQIQNPCQPLRWSSLRHFLTDFSLGAFKTFIRIHWKTSINWYLKHWTTNTYQSIQTLHAVNNCHKGINFRYRQGSTSDITNKEKLLKFSKCS